MNDHQSPALAQLDDPTVLGHLRDYYEFLGSAELFYCKVCDEEWPVFDREWPQAGVDTAGELAGVDRRGHQGNRRATEGLLRLPFHVC